MNPKHHTFASPKPSTLNLGTQYTLEEELGVGHPDVALHVLVALGRLYGEIMGR